MNTQATEQPDYELAAQTSPDYRASVKQAEANARLIALAPEMAEALRALEPMFDNDGPLFTVYAAEIAQARALLAKLESGE